MNLQDIKFEPVEEGRGCNVERIKNKNFLFANVVGLIQKLHLILAMRGES